MAIIIEGPDNSGKTTLANRLSDKLKMPIFHAGGPPGSNELAERFCDKQYQLSKNPVILDRITPISRQVYENRFQEPSLMDWLVKFIEKPRNIVVYCRPPNENLMDFSTHEIKEHDTDDHIAYITENQQNFIELYDRIMVIIPCVIYNWANEDISFDNFAEQLYFTQIIDYYKTKLTGRFR